MIPRSLRLVTVAAATVLLVAACSASSTPKPSEPPGSPSPSPAASAGASADASAGANGCPTSQPAALAAGQVRDVTLKTGAGDIAIKVEGSLGPNAAGNFVALAECGYYDGTVFHRIVPGFVIQGGDGQYGRVPLDPTTAGTGGPGYAFPDDPVTVGYTRGTVAMANSGPDTNGSQFFICLADLTSLPPNFSVFGHVTAGMDVVDRIAAMPNSGDTTGNLALQPVPIDSTTVTTP